MRVKITVYDRCKVYYGARKLRECIYNDVVGIEIKTICDETIYKHGFDEVDRYKQYLKLTFSDGTTSLYRESYIDFSFVL